MARWKLMTAHYLNLVDPTEFEYKETDRRGKTIRKKYNVPRMLDPRDPDSWNNIWGANDDREGEVIICLPGKGAERDYEFLGDPSPDMIPLDDEAKAISASFESRWAFKPDGAEISYSQSLVDNIQAQMAETAAKPATVEIAGMDALIAAQTNLTAMFAQLLTANTPGAAHAAIRR
jgi:hypothetical protein